MTQFKDLSLHVNAAACTASCGGARLMRVGSIAVLVASADRPMQRDAEHEPFVGELSSTVN